MANLGELLEKTADWDKDERYMATSDLCAELQKDVKIDASMERRVCTAILKRLDDPSNDVQSIAVKCLGILVKKVQEAQVTEIGNKLCSLILEGNEALRDIYCIGIKTLISDVPDHMGRSVATMLAPRLLAGVRQDDVPEVKLECLDIMSDLLKRFGADVEAEHRALSDATLAQLAHPKPVVLKRAIGCLASLAVVLSDALLDRLVDTLLGHIQSPLEGQVVSTLIQTIGSICRTVGFRLGRDLDRVVPLFLQFCGDPEDEDAQDEKHDELRENCLQGFEAFVLRCPREVAPHLAAMVQTCQGFVTYDPNYTYATTDEGEPDEDDEEYSDDDDDDGFSDDDDSSWKVRRAALHVLAAVVATRPELLLELYVGKDAAAGEGDASMADADAPPPLADMLVARFKEREENVRLDVLAAFTEQLKATASQGGAGRGPSAEARALAAKVPTIVGAAVKLMGPKGSAKTKSAVFAMLRQLVTVLPGGLAPHFGALMGAVLGALQDKATGIKLDALVFLRLLLQTHEPACAHPHLAEVVPRVVACVAEDWYKLIAEALRVVGVLAQTVRPLAPGGDMFAGGFDHAPFVAPLYGAVIARLQAHDIDQEIKESAIIAMGAIISSLGDCDMGAQVEEVLALLMHRLRNEITRLPALKALATIASSPAGVDLTSTLGAAVTELVQFLRQQSRSLKQTTLETLDALVCSNGKNMDGALFEAIVKEASSLISEHDLHLSYLALRLTVSALGASAAVRPAVAREVLPRALVLARSPLLQGMALRSLKGFFRELASADAAAAAEGLGFAALFAALVDPVTSGAKPLPKPAVANLARCIAVLCVSTADAECAATVHRFVGEVQDDGSSDVVRHLALMSLGEVGRERDLTAEAGLQDVILAAFEDENGTEETKAAAAFALGNVAVGNMGAYLPVLLQALDAGGRNEYLLLSALKEVIHCHTATAGLDFAPFVDGALPPLTRHCGHAEEGVRNMVAECLGKLAIIAPERIVPKLVELCGGGADEAGVYARWTAVTALKTCMAASAMPLEPLVPHFARFMEALDDEDLSVRRAALLTLNSAAHHQPQLLADLLDGLIFPTLHRTMALIIERKVDLGPFKHTVDDALPLRKAAFGCMDTLLDTMPERVNMPLFLSPHLCAGLTDKDADVQVLCHQILVKACDLQPAVVLATLDDLVEPLDKSVNRKRKKAAVGTELERENDLVRSALRAVDAVNNVYDRSSTERKFREFMDRIMAKEQLATMMAAIQQERRE